MSDHYQLWSEISNLPGKQFQVLSGTESDDVKSLRRILDDTEAISPNRPRRAQNA
jgi:hypothetical protein